MEKNLSVSTFRNGDQIKEVKSIQEWHEALKKREPAWCNYEFDSKYDTVYGKIYNVFAILDWRGLAPEGWRISTEADWIKLIEGFEKGRAGVALKSVEGWTIGEKKKADKVAGTNASGFNGLAGGNLIYPLVGNFTWSSQGFGIQKNSSWWTNSPSIYTRPGSIPDTSNMNLTGFSLYYNSEDCNNIGAHFLNGYYVRCVKDSNNPINNKPELHEFVVDSVAGNYSDGTGFCEMEILNNRPGGNRYDPDLWDFEGRPRRYMAIGTGGSLEVFRSGKWKVSLQLMDPYTRDQYEKTKMGYVQQDLKQISNGVYEAELICSDKSKATVIINPCDSIRIVGSDWSLVFNKFGQQSVIGNDLDFYGVDQYKKMYGIKEEQ
jgi:uncharacterized protein (TIGR02145 family)